MLNDVTELIEDIKQGKMVLLVDDEDRENEGDLVLAGEFATADQINFMVKEARGLVCLAMSKNQSDRLGLSLMVGDTENNSPNKTAFTVSIEAREGITTGISAADRAHTVRVASKPDANSMSIITPGHIFPIRAKSGGVLQRQGHTEGSVDLMKLAGLHQSAVICEVMNDDGTMARLPELLDFAKKHNIKIGSIEQLIDYRLQNEDHVEVYYEEKFESDDVGPLKTIYFKDLMNDRIHYALVSGDIKPEENTLVRVHVDRGPEDLVNSKNKKALNNFLKEARGHGGGVVVVLRNSNFIEAPQTKSQKTENNKEYGVGAQILKKLNVKNINLATNSTHNLVGLSAFGVEVKKTTPYSNFY